MLFWKINRKWWNRNWTANTLIKNSEVGEWREIVFHLDRKKTLVSWPRSLTLLLALFVNDDTSICQIYYFQSQSNGDLAKKIYFDAGIICQICYNVFFQVITYICQSVFNISRALTMVTWPRSLTLLLAVFILSLGLAFVTLAVWITLRYSCL